MRVVLLVFGLAQFGCGRVGYDAQAGLADAEPGSGAGADSAVTCIPGTAEKPEMFPTVVVENFDLAGGRTWANPDNIGATDDVASGVSLAPDEMSTALVGSDFGFDFPATAELANVTIEIVGKTSLYGDISPVRMHWIAPDGRASPMQSSASYPTVGRTSHNYWNDADELIGLTLAEVESADFRVAFAMQNFGTRSDIVSIDSVKLEVQYRCP